MGKLHRGAINRRRALRVPLAVLVVALVLSAGAAFLFRSAARRDDEVRFTDQRNKIRYMIEGNLSVYIELLTATRGFVYTPGNLERTRFATFIDHLGIQRDHKGIQGIGFTKVVRPGEQAALVRRMKAEGVTDFSPYPAAGRDIRQAIIYLEPQDERNRRAIGYDMSSEVRREEAISRATDTGLASATSRITLVQEITSDKQPGFLIYLPVYSDSTLPETVEERRRKIQGFVYAPFRAGDFFEEIRESIGSDEVTYAIYDGTEDVESLLFKNGDVQAGPTTFWSRWSRPKEMSFRDELEVAGKKWLVVFRAGEAFESRSLSTWTPIVGLAGVGFSGALFFLLYSEFKTRFRAQDLVKSLTEAQEQNRRLFEKESAVRKQAEAANKIKDEFISVVSHELRTPLNVIAGWARVLRAHDITLTTRDAALDKIERNLRLQASLVEDLLTLSQIASGSFSLQNNRFEMASVVSSVLSELEPIILEKKLVIHAHDGSGGIQIPGDPDKIRQVVVKLLSNAVKFTPNHGEIDVSLLKGEDVMTLTVRDTGRGISKEFLPFIFERFRQDDTSTTRRFGGLGLGLTICEHIVTMHGGTIEAKSEGEEMGAEFVVTLPIGEGVAVNG